MSQVRALMQRLRTALFDEPDVNLSEEVRFHLDMEADYLRQRGLNDAEARREARRRFGGVDRHTEDLRDLRTTRWLGVIVADARLALRLIRRFPLFATVVIFTIALGIGASTAIFSAVDAVLLRPLPFDNGSRLVSLWASNPDKSITRFGVSYPDFRDWSARTHSFAEMGLYASSNTTLTTPDGPESVAMLSTTRNFLHVIGLRPELGRLFGADDERGESSNSVILTHGFWIRRFGGDRSIIGKTISAAGRPRTVIGVLGPEAQLLGAGYVGAPLDIVTVIEFSTYPNVDRHGQHLFGTMARLRPGTTLEQARADLLGVATQLAAQYPEIAGWTASVFPLSEDLSATTKDPLLVLLAASALLMIIACINVANVVLVRGTARTREIAVRRALGASRARVVTQLVVESVILALAGGAIGVMIGALALRMIRARLPFGTIVQVDDMHLDTTVLAFAAGLSLLSALAFGLWPAIRAGSFVLASTLRDRGQGGSGAHSRRVRRGLVICEIATACVLLVSAALVWQSVRRMLRVNPGFRVEQTVTGQITLGNGYPDSAAIPFYRRLLTELEGRPGIDAAGATDTPPLTGAGIFTSVHLLGEPPRPPGQPLMSTVRMVTPGFFRAMGMQLMAGHDMEWTEPTPSILLSRSAAKAFWPGRRVVERQIGFNVNPTGYPIVGEVNDTRQVSLATAPGPVVYVSMRRFASVIHTMTVVVHGRGETSGLVATMRDVLRGIDPSLPLYNVQSLSEIVDESTAQARLDAFLIEVFALVALALAAVGMYGVVSYSVTKRQHEIGVRIALGAQPADVLRLVLGEGATLAVAGALAGIGGAVFATRFIEAWLFGIGRGDPATYGAVVGGLTIVAIVASYLPARRALRVDPLRAMRLD